MAVYITKFALAWAMTMGLAERADANKGKTYRTDLGWDIGQGRRNSCADSSFVARRDDTVTDRRETIVSAWDIRDLIRDSIGNFGREKKMASKGGMMCQDNDSTELRLLSPVSWAKINVDS